MKKFTMKSIKTKNNMLKIFSLIFAIFLWSYVRSEVDPERTVTFRAIPVRYENVAEIKANNLSLLTPEDATVNVTVKGRQSNIAKLKKDNVTASINLSGYYAGEYSLPIKIQIDANNVVVDSKEPESIKVKIDENISKKLPVNIKVVGKLDESYVLGNIKQEDYVMVKGPKSYVDSIDKLLAKVDISGKTESTVISADIVPYDKDGNIIEDIVTKPEKLDIELPILKTETVPVKLNYIGNVPENVDVNQFSVEPSTVAIKGNSAQMNKIKEINTVPISVNELLKGQRSIELQLPEGISLVDKDVKFVASASPIVLNKQTIEIPIRDIKTKNVEKHTEIEYLGKEDKIKINLIPKDPLSKEVLSKEDVYASIDVLDLSEGEHSVKLDISVPETFKITSVTPEKVLIKVTKNKLF